MNWYYVESGEQRGPVTDADLEALAKSGTIQPTTLVWHEGMADWQPYQQAKPAGSGLRMQAATQPAVEATPAPAAAPSPGLGNLEAGGAVCAECNRLFALDEVIKHGNSYVCAACKPAFLQKIREGVSLKGSMNYAGFWVRFGAKFIDGLILRLIGWALGAVIGLVLSKANPLAMSLGVIAGGVIVNLAYNTFFIGKFGATPGKMAAKLRVVNPDGSPVSYGKAFGRYFAEIVSGLIFAIGYLMAAWDPEKRALHDRICSTRVVKM